MDEFKTATELHETREKEMEELNLALEHIKQIAECHETEDIKKMRLLIAKLPDISFHHIECIAEAVPEIVKRYNDGVRSNLVMTSDARQAASTILNCTEK